MKLLTRLLGIALVCMAVGLHVNSAQAASKTSIELCGSKDVSYKFALCAATTCTPTGKRIAVNTPQGGTRWFKEALCTCPVLDTLDTGLPAIANVNGGNMQGSCARPNVATVWSLYSTATPFPQLSDSNATTPPTPPTWSVLAAGVQQCSASLNQGREFAQCFSFKCDNIRTSLEGGVTTTVADCRCPLGEDVFSALPAKAATSFVTGAGTSWSNTASACYQHPVGGF